MAAPYYVPGPVTVNWDGELGTLKEGVRIRVNGSLNPITDDLHGAEPADFIITGRSAIIEIISVDYTALVTRKLFDLSHKSKVGTLASTLAKELTITEGKGVWKAPLAYPQDPATLHLRSIDELQVPLVFMIIPNDELLLFTTVPPYVRSS